MAIFMKPAREKNNIVHPKKKVLIVYFSVTLLINLHDFLTSVKNISRYFEVLNFKMSSIVSLRRHSYRFRTMMRLSKQECQEWTIPLNVGFEWMFHFPSTNILSVFNSLYQSLSAEVILENTKLSKYVSISYISHCKNGVSRKGESTCSNISIGDEVREWTQ